MLADGVVRFISRADKDTKKEFVSELPPAFIETLAKNSSNYPLLLGWLIHHFEQPTSSESSQMAANDLIEDFACAMPYLSTLQPALVDALKKETGTLALLLKRALARTFIFSESAVPSRFNWLVEEYQQGVTATRQQLQANTRDRDVLLWNLHRLTAGYTSFGSLQNGTEYLLIGNDQMAHLIVIDQHSIAHGYWTSHSFMKAVPLDTHRIALIHPDDTKKIKIINLNQIQPWPRNLVIESEFTYESSNGLQIGYPTISSIVMINENTLAMGGLDGIRIVDLKGRLIHILKGQRIG